MDSILEPIIRSPRFPQLVEELEEVRTREAECRRAFRANLDEDVRSEFINGEVIIQMTARDEHMITVQNLMRVISTYVIAKQLGAVRMEQALTEFTRNDYVPDICYWSSAKALPFGQGTTVYPVPDFIAEVLSPSTESRDRGVKFEDYAAHGVAEYWIVDPELRIVEQFALQQGGYHLLAKLDAGNITSSIIPGLVLPVAAVFDEPANLAALRRMLA